MRGRGERGAQHARKDVRRRALRRRVQGREAQRLPDRGERAARRRGEMPGDGFVGTAEILSCETAVPGEERDALRQCQSFRGQKSARDVERCRRVPGLEGESAGLCSAERAQRERQPAEQPGGVDGRMHGAHQRQRLPVRAEEHVLAVVELDAVDDDAARAAPQRSRLLDDRHRKAGIGERDRRGASRPAATHHGDARRRCLKSLSVNKSRDAFDQNAMGSAKDGEARGGSHGRAGRQRRPRILVKPFGNGQLGPIALSLGLPWGATQGGTSLRALGPICRVRTRDLLTDKL